ncbi:hypothetical protein M0R36_00565 [bacterium]|nr:hypothetical protein [bacterium]
MKKKYIFTIILAVGLPVLVMSIDVFAKNNINAIIPENADGTRKISQERFETVEKFIRKEILLSGLTMKMDVPSNWVSSPGKFTERSVKSFSIAGPRNVDNTYTVNLRVKVYPAGKFDGIEDMMDNISGKTDSRDITVSGISAKEVFSENSVSLPLYSVNDRTTDILTVCAGFEVGKDIVQIKYSADKRDFYEYKKVYDRIVGSLEVSSGK